VAGDVFLADGTGATGAGGSARVVELALEVRAESVAIAAAEARRLRWVAEFADEVVYEACAMLSSEGRGPAAPGELIRSVVVGEVQAVLGVSEAAAGRLVDLARRLRAVLPETLAALETGRLDLTRARVLCEATAVLDDAVAREVQARLLGVAGQAPWEGLSPRAWRARVERAVLRADVEAARRRRVEAYARRLVWTRTVEDGMGEFLVVGDAGEVAMAEQVLTDLARARPGTDAEGGRVSMDQRRVDAFFELFRRVRDGHDLPGVSVRRERELGLVLHADTFFGAGPAAQDPGEVRGLSGLGLLDPVTAREQARAMTGAAAGPTGPAGAVNALLVDRSGVLARVVRLPRPPPGGWTRALLEAAVTAGLDHLEALSCQAYSPTVAITEHVRARNPRCTGYDCPRRVARCDLDHDTPWPRGPTAAANLGPRCRRQHEIKTRGLVGTRLHPDGSLEHTMLTGLTITTRPEPLPGHAPGEGHARGPVDTA
jgi:hypothetical protein